MHIVLEPGDMTKYHFLVENSEIPHVLYVAGEPRFDLYPYDTDEVNRIYKMYSDFLDSTQDTFMADPFIHYICKHSNCSPWTARAAIMAMKNFMDLEKNNYE